MKKLKVLNLYAGIGGNRKLWKNVEVTAVENVPEIAKIYQEFFPEDKVIIADAHQYLLEHFQEFDFIWSSPPCPTHSRMRKVSVATGTKHKFPDMRLYEEIIFLEHWFKGKWVVENVISYYEPLIKPQESGRHYFWCNFKIKNLKFDKLDIRYGKTGGVDTENGFDLRGKKFGDKRLLLRNCVNAKLGLHIFNQAFNKEQGVL